MEKKPNFIKDPIISADRTLLFLLDPNLSQL